MRVRILLSTMACLLFMSASTVAQSSSKPPVQTPPAPQGANQSLPGIGAPMKGSATKGVGSIKPGAALGKTAPVDNSEINNRPKKMIKSNEQWRRELTPLEYSVTREGGTERAFSGKYWNYKKDGIYVCTCCDLVLFDAKTKFESGTGWPSYWQPAKPESILEIRDTSHGMMRREVRCSRCDAHLGHVFADGPRPTGQRYCINSAALKFKQKADGKLKSGEKQGAPGQSPAGTNESEGSAAGKNDKK